MKTVFALALALACACSPALSAPGDYETIYIHDIAGGKKLFTTLLAKDAKAHPRSVPLYYAKDTATCKILVHELPGNIFEGNLTCNSPNAKPLHYNLQGIFKPLKTSIGRRCQQPKLDKSTARSHTISVVCEDKLVIGTFTIPR